MTDDRGVDATGDAVVATDVTSQGDSEGVYATDTVTPLAWLTLTGSLRYDRTHLSIDNRLTPESSGASTFDRVDPGAGANLRWNDRLDFYAHYGESFRAPSAIELTCANETAPCPLPIAFSADPPLKKVVAHSYEVGAHAESAGGVRASLAFFLTNVDDDIFFVSSSRSAGFFQNVDETRRMGVEASAQGHWRAIDWFLNYSFTRATFESTVSLPSATGENVAHPGDELPGVPLHLFKSGIDAPLPYGFRIGADLQFTGRQYLRGDEANDRSQLSSYTAVNARLSYTYEHVTLFARAENLFDAEYETFGVYAANPLAGGRVERFLSPGAPLGGWFGVRVEALTSSARSAAGSVARPAERRNDVRGAREGVHHARRQHHARPAARDQRGDGTHRLRPLPRRLVRHVSRLPGRLELLLVLTEPLEVVEVGAVGRGSATGAPRAARASIRRPSRAAPCRARTSRSPALSPIRTRGRRSRPSRRTARPAGRA